MAGRYSAMLMLTLVAAILQGAKSVLSNDSLEPPLAYPPVRNRPRLSPPQAPTQPPSPPPRPLHSAPGRPPPPPSNLVLDSLACSITIIGELSYFMDSGAAAVDPSLWVPERIEIICGTAGLDGRPATDADGVTRDPQVQLEVGGRLLELLAAGGPEVKYSPNLVLLPSPTDISGFSLTVVSRTEHFTLVDSTLLRVPLSFNPLLACTSCQRVSVLGVRMEALRGSPEQLLGCDVYSYDMATLVGRTVGPLYFENVVDLDVDDLACIDVRHANDFSCLLVQLTAHSLVQPGAFVLTERVTIRRSEFRSTEVKQGNCFVYSDLNMGFGAIVVYVAYETLAALPLVELDDVIVQRNQGGVGAGLAINADATMAELGALRVTRSTFSGNTARKHGGAVFVGYLGGLAMGLLHVTDSDLQSNEAGRNNEGSGGAIACHCAVEQLVVDGASRVDDNTADVSGGAIWVERGVRTLSIAGNSSVSRNVALLECGGGIYVEANWDLGEDTFIAEVDALTIDGASAVDDNVAAWFGGGLFLSANVSRISVLGRSSVSHNRVIGTERGKASGGGLYVGRTAAAEQAAGPRDDVTNGLQYRVGALLLSDGSYIYNNSAIYRGGGVYIYGSVVGDGIVIQHKSYVNDNRLISDYAQAGAGLAVCGRLTSLVINNSSSISRNVLEILRGYNGPMMGGGVWVNDYLQRLVISNSSQMSRNKALKGGAAMVVYAIEGPAVKFEEKGLTYTIDSILITGNSCVCDNLSGDTDIAEYTAGSGAMAFFQSRVASFVITDGSCLCRNIARTGDGNGGALYAMNGIDYLAVCNRSGLSYNQGGNGGAVHLQSVHVQNSTGAFLPSLGRFELCGGSNMSFNEARVTGGAMHVKGVMGNLSISGNSVVANNLANNAGGVFYFVAMFRQLSIVDSRVINNEAMFDHGGVMFLNIQTRNHFDDVEESPGTPTQPRLLPEVGPYHMNIEHSLVSGNSAFKNGGAFALQLYYYQATIADAGKRLRLLRERYINIRIFNSCFERNWAHFGAGGVISYITLMPIDQEGMRPAAAFLGAFISISSSNFTGNTAGDASNRLLFVQDVSPNQGNGGALFLWAVPFSVGGSSSGNPAPQQPESASCMQPEEDLPPGLPTFANVSCWPRGSRVCALLLDRVVMTGNSAIGGYGGGVNAAQCAVKVVRSRFTNNTSTIRGGGLAFMDYQTYWYITLTNFSAIPSSASKLPEPPAVPLGLSSAGVSPYQPQDLSLLPSSLSSIFQNIVGSRPLQQPFLVMYDTVFNSNTATDAAAAFLEINRTSAVIIRCSFTDNKARVDAGGVMLISNSTIAKVTAVFRDVNFTRNNAGSVGGGLLVHATHNKAATIIVGGTMEENNATKGGAVFSTGIQGTTLMLWGVTLNNNTAYISGGAIAFEHSSYKPAPPQRNNPALNLPVYETIVCFLSCKLQKNRGQQSGGGAFLILSPQVRAVVQQTTVTMGMSEYGAGLYTDISRGGHLVISSSSLTDNAALYQGGAIYATTNCGGQLTIDANSLLAGNSAGEYGGAVMVIRADSSRQDRRSNATTSSAAAAAAAAAPSSSSSNSSSTLDAPCNLPSLVISNVTVTRNTAQQGAGVYAARETVVSVDSSTLTNNTAWLSGGAIAAVIASLLHVRSSHVSENLATLSGGGVFADRCTVFVMEQGSLMLNTASTGGGIHVAGPRIAIGAGSDGSSSSSRRSRLQQVADDQNGSSSAVTDEDFAAASNINPVAVLSQVNVDGNAAAAGLYVQSATRAATTGTAGLSDAALSFLAAAEEYQPYEGHGGGMFFSGRVGVAISSSSAGAGNAADVGTILATTQACSTPYVLYDQKRVAVAAAANLSDNLVVEQLLAAVSGGRRWSSAVSSLRWAASLQCALLVMQETRLPTGVSSSAAPSSSLSSDSSAAANTRSSGYYSAVKTASSRRQAQLSLPLLWLQDLSASSLRARCSSSSTASAAGISNGGSDSEEQGIIAIVRQAMNVQQQQQQQLQPAGPADSSSNSNSSSNNDSASVATAPASISAPPQTSAPGSAPPSVRRDVLNNYANILPMLLQMLLPCGEPPELQGETALSRTLPLAVPATHLRLMNISGALLIPSGTISGLPPYISSTGGRNFREVDIKTVIIAPNAVFDVEFQLFDGLGQPVVVDTPTFEVSMAIRPVDTSGANGTVLALLRSTDSMSLDVMTSSRGVVAWRGMELLGWPGKYMLDVKAKGATSNTALPEIQPLALQVELLPCEMGQELDRSKDRDHVAWTGCTTCRRDLVGLWLDHRALLQPPSPSPSPSRQSPSSSLSQTQLLESMSRETRLLTTSVNGEPCPACCVSCPSNAACPGGSLLVPIAGYWHSSPSSPLMHRCPQPSACGLALGAEPLDKVWNQTLKARFNITDSYVVINTSSPTPSLVNASSSGVIPLGEDDLILVSLRNDIRGLLLAACQQWWYSTFPPNQEAVLVSLYDIALQVNMTAAPCFLHREAALYDTDRWYMQLQCGAGYTGNLCATCMPGYSLTVDFDCMACPSLARTVSMGLLAFWGTVVLILFTTFSNLSKNRAEAMQMEELSALDLLKTLITHIQYFIIITKLGINYPEIIQKMQSVLSAITGTENYIAYSPSCLFSGLDAAGQAATQIGFGLCAPCTATLITLVLWALRYFLANQSLLRRVFGKRMAQDKLPKDLFPAKRDGGGDGDGDDDDDGDDRLGQVGDLGSPFVKATGSRRLPNCLSHGTPQSTITPSTTIAQDSSSGLLPLTSTCPAPLSGGKLLDGSGGVVLHSPTSDAADPATAAVAATPSAAAGHQVDCHGNAIVDNGTNDDCSGIGIGIGSGSGSGSGGITGDGMGSGGVNKTVAEAARAADGAAARHAAAQNLTAPYRSKLKTSSHRKRSSTGGGVFAGGGGGSGGGTSRSGEVRIQLDAADSPSGTIKAVRMAPAISLTAAATSAEAPPALGPAPAPAAPAGETSTPSVDKASGAFPPRGSGGDLKLTPSQQGPNPFANPVAAFATRGIGISGGGGGGSGGARAVLPTMRSADSDFDAEADGVPRPFAVAQYQPHLVKDSWRQALANMFANPGQWLMFADQAVPLLQQLEVVVIVASFILYPSLCQTALSIFACYQLDSAEGLYSQNQQATWRKGYWVRNMQQQCYTGVHERVFVPIGIASVLLFCFCPPVVYFLLTFLSRRHFDDPRVRVQYGFLFQQYKPKYFWWASMRQLQVLALVAVEVFGRALPVLQQALLLLAILILIAAVNTANSPERFHELLILEFLSMCVLSLTLTLGLYFVSDDVDTQLDNTSATIVGSIILVINAVFILVVLFFMGKRSAEAARKVHRILSTSWHTVVTSVSRAISRIEFRHSGERGSTRHPTPRVSIKVSAT